MAVTAKRVENEPIVIFTYEGHLDASAFKDVIALNAKYAEEIKEPLYIIADVRAMETNFFEMLKIMQEARQEGPGTVNDPNLKMLMFVGSTPLVQMYQDNMTRMRVPLGMAMFPTLEEALETAHVQINANKPTKPQDNKPPHDHSTPQ